MSMLTCVSACRWPWCFSSASTNFNQVSWSLPSVANSTRFFTKSANTLIYSCPLRTLISSTPTQHTLLKSASAYRLLVFSYHSHRRDVRKDPCRAGLERRLCGRVQARQPLVPTYRQCLRIRGAARPPGLVRRLGHELSRHRSESPEYGSWPEIRIWHLRGQRAR